MKTNATQFELPEVGAFNLAGERIPQVTPQRHEAPQWELGLLTEDGGRREQTSLEAAAAAGDWARVGEIITERNRRLTDGGGV